MSDVEVSIGGNLSPIQRSFAELKVQAQEAGESAGFEFGNRTAYMAEERVKHGMDGVLKSLATAKDPIDAISGAVEGISQSFRIAGPALLAFAAVSKLGEALKTGYDLAKKFAGSIQDALSINSDNSAKSLEQMDEEIARLKEDMKAEDLSSMTALDAGATVVVQALENGKTFSAQVLEDAENYNAAAEQAHAEEDAAASRSIDQQNEILELKIAGNTEAADAARDELDDLNKLADLTRKGDADAVAALNEQIRLKAQLRQAETTKKGDEELKSIDAKISVENSKQDEIGKSEKQKLADATARVKAAQDKIDQTKNSPLRNPKSEADLEDIVNYQAHNPNYRQEEAIEDDKQRLELEQAITAQKRLQAEVGKSDADKAAEQARKNYETFQKINRETEQRARERAEKATRLQELQSKRAELLKEQIDDKGKLAAAQAQAMGFHGSVSSLRREGFGRTPTVNQNGAQLKAANEANMHLLDVKAQITQLNDKIGGSA